MNWTLDMTETLRELWAAKGADGKPLHSAASIAWHISMRPPNHKVTKNAVLGKVKREGLEPRQSPIVRGAERARRRPSRNPAQWTPADLEAPESASAPPTAPVQLPPGSCQWIEGEPRADDSNKCGKPVLSGSPYCAHHELRAYNRGPSRLKDETKKGFLKW